MKHTPDKPHVRQPSRTWKKNYPCRPAKGLHEFELVIPSWINIPVADVKSYYSVVIEATLKRRLKSSIAEVCCEFKCKHCNKLKMIGYKPADGDTVDTLRALVKNIKQR